MAYCQKNENVEDFYFSQISKRNIAFYYSELLYAVYSIDKITKKNDTFQVKRKHGLFSICKMLQTYKIIGSAIRMSYCRIPATEGAEVFISCKQLK